MANLADFSELLAQESRLAQSYEKLETETSNEDYKKKLGELKQLSEQKMKLVYALINDIPWFSDDT